MPLPTLRWKKSELPTTKAVAAVTQGPEGLWVLASNELEKDDAPGDPGSVLLLLQDGQWIVHSNFPGQALRSLHATLDGQLFAVGVRGACLRYQDGAWAHQTIPFQETLRTVFGTSADAIYAAGHNSLLHFDGARWTAVDLPRVLGPKSEPSLLFGSAVTPEEVWVVGSDLAGCCALTGSGQQFVSKPPGAYFVYAVRALDDGALVLTNDGAWRFQDSKWRQVVDLKDQSIRPFGNPGFIDEYEGHVVMGSVDGRGLLQSLFQDVPLETHRFNLWYDGELSRVALDEGSAVTHMGMNDGRIFVGTRGALWETTL